MHAGRVEREQCKENTRSSALLSCLSCKKYYIHADGSEILGFPKNRFQRTNYRLEYENSFSILVESCTSRFKRAEKNTKFSRMTIFETYYFPH